MQSIDSIETYAYGMSKDLVCKKEAMKCSNIIKQYENVSLQWNKTYVFFITKEDMKKDNLNWLQIPDHPYKILIVGSSGFEEKNALLHFNK